MKPLLGIDFGTATARAALVMGGDIAMVSLTDGAWGIPSVCAFPTTAFRGGPPLVGVAATSVALHHPERTITAIKRLLGRKLEAPEVRHHRQAVAYDLVGARNGDARVRVGRRHHAPQDVAGYILGTLRTAAERQAGEPVTDVVVAVPALFDDLQRQAIRDAARIAGLDVLGMISETSAAVLGSHVYPAARGEERKVLVYDLGAGSFEVTAMIVDDRRAEVVASGGDAFLGGEDFDQRIVSFICEEVLRMGGGDLRRDRSLLAKLKLVAERAKVQLSSSTAVDIQLPDSAGRQPLVVRLERDRLETLTQDLVDRTVWSCESVLRDAKWMVSAVDIALVVGGQTRMPRIRAQLDDLCGKPPLDLPTPDAVVAMGAARQAIALAGGERGRTRARAGSAVVEMTCLSLGFESAGGVFTRLIPRGTPLPATRTQLVGTGADGQTQILIHLLQGEREMASDNESVARIQIGPIPARPRGEVQIELEIGTDGGGLPSVSARLAPDGEARPLRMRPSAGLTESEISALAAARNGGPLGGAAVMSEGSDQSDDDLGTVDGEREVGPAPGIDPAAHGG